MEYIRPSADLRNKYSELSKLCRETEQPIAITVNGRGDTALINLAVYNRQLAELELLKALAKADEDVRLGRVKPAEEVFARIRKELDERK